MQSLDEIFGKATTPTSPSPAAPVGSQPSLDQIFGGVKPTQSTTQAPAPAPKSSLPAGYGASNLVDPVSGKPLLTYENQNLQSSQLLSDRVAPSFDFTKPQKLSPDMLKNPRMSENISQSIRSQLGATAKQQLDHIMPVEMGGANTSANLRLEPTVKGVNTATDPIENQMTQKAMNGEISVLDAWKNVAAAKGITLGEDQGLVPKTQISQAPTPSFFDSVYGKIRNIFMGVDPAQVKAQAMKDYYEQTHPNAPKLGSEPLAQFTNSIANMPPLERAISAMVAASAVVNPIGTLTSVGEFMGLDMIAKKAIGMITGKNIQNFSDVLPAGVPQYAKDLVDVISFIGEGAAVHGINKTAPGVVESLTKNIATEYNLPKQVFIDPEKVKSIFQTGEKISPEETKMVQDLGLNADQYKQAIKNGVNISVPIEKITTITDKPYWAKLKSAIGVEPAEPKISREFPGAEKPSQGPAGLLGAGETPVEAPTAPSGLTIARGGSLDEIFKNTRLPGAPGGMLPPEVSKPVESSIQLPAQEKLPGEHQTPERIAQLSSRDLAKSMSDSSKIFNETYNPDGENIPRDREMYIDEVIKRVEKLGLDGFLKEAGLPTGVDTIWRNLNTGTERPLLYELTGVQGMAANQVTDMPYKEIKDQLMEHLQPADIAYVLENWKPAEGPNLEKAKYETEQRASKIAEEKRLKEEKRAKAAAKRSALPQKEQVKPPVHEGVEPPLPEIENELGTKGPSITDMMDYMKRNGWKEAEVEKIYKKDGEQGITDAYENTAGISQYSVTEKGKAVTEEVKKPTLPKGSAEFHVAKYDDKGKATFEKIAGKPVDIVPGVNTFIHKDLQKGWNVSDAKTGLALLGHGEPTQAKAIAAAKAKIDEVGVDKVKALVEEKSKQYGISPSFKEPASMKPLPEILSEKPAQTESVTLHSGFDPGLDKFLNEDVKPGLQGAGAGVIKFFKEVVNLLNPKAFVDTKTLDEIFKMKGAQAKAEAVLDLATAQAERAMDKMPEKDLVDFVDRIKEGKAQKTPELQAVADFIRQADDQLYSAISQFKPDLPWQENHLRVLWKTVPGQPEAKGFLGIFKRPLRGTMGFMKRATLENMSEGIKAGGVPVSYNPLTMFKMAYQDGMKFITANRMWQNFGDLKIRQWLEWKNKMPDGFVELQDNIKRTIKEEAPAGAENGRWVVEEGAGRLLNNYLSRDLIRATALGRGAMWVKNTSTAMELSLSAFHWTFESIEAMSSSMGLGFRKFWNLGLIKGDIKMVAEGLKDILKSPLAPKELFQVGRKTLAMMKNADEFLTSDAGKKFIKQFPDGARLVNDFFNAGGLLKMSHDYEIGTTKTFLQNLNNGNYIGAAIRGLPALNETLMKPLFQNYIPALKMGMFMKEFPTRLLEKADDLASGKTTREELARQTWAFTENRLGEMNFDNLFWNKTFKTSLQLLFRSVTWKLGNIRAFSNSITGQASEFWAAAKEGRAPQVTPEAAWVFALIINTAIISTIVMKAYSGKYPQTIKDLVYPQSDPNDPNQRMSVPTYLRDAFSLAHSPVGYAGSSLSSELGKFWDLAHNSDFYGTEIYNTHDPLYKQMYQSATYMVPLPFSVQNMLQPGQSPARKVGGFIGLTKAPAYISQTPIQQSIFGLYQTRFGGGTQTQEQAAAAKAKTDIRDAYIHGDTETANKLLGDAIKKGYIKPAGVDTFIREADVPGDVRAFNRLDAADQESLISKMDMQELMRYAWGASNQTKAKFNEISSDTQQFVKELNAGKIKPPVWKKQQAQ